MGEELLYPLDQFEVSLTPGELSTPLRLKGDPQEASRLSLMKLNPAPGYVAALAMEGPS